MPDNPTKTSPPPQPATQPSARRAVQRARTKSYLLWTLVALAASVIVTRTYLEVTGYPQIGGGDLHIAHAIWGGLLLYVAALLPLIFVNNWALTASAILNGVGAGLFVDEIGKFITRNNDYFYPPAAPLVYSFFLLTVLLFVLLRRTRRRDPRAELFRALEELQDLVDGNLDTGAVQRLEARLEAVTAASDANLAQLGGTLRAYVQQVENDLERPQPGWARRLSLRIEGWGRRLGRRNHRIVIVIMLLWGSLTALANVAILTTVAVAPDLLDESVVALLVSTGELRSVNELPWFVARLVLESTAGLLTMCAIVLLFMRREARAIGVAIFAVTLSLTTVVLLTFYLDQFGAMYGALLEFFSLMILITYRRWYLENPTGAP
ncbi:MAG: hypothetical protein V9G19_10970 [Tetrasphaera sp.]